MPGLNGVLGILERQDAWGNSLLRWLIAVVAALTAFLVLRLTRRLLIRHASRLAEKAADQWSHAVALENLVRRTKTWLLLILALYCGRVFVALSDHVSQIATSVIVVALLIQGALWANALLSFAVSRYIERHKDVDAAGVTTLSALRFLGRLTIWAAVVLLAMEILGINVTALIAGLGIGGIAVALAAQNILGDLFASASIVLDKPFVLGDFIIVGDDMGSVEYIGLKTTRLRSLSGEQLIFSNTDLLKSRIHNYKRMAERRVLFTLDVAYGTPYEKVAAIPAMLREAVEAQKPARFDRAHFARYGESALVFEVVYYVLAADYNLYMDVQQEINLFIFRRFAEERIEFAFPTRTIHLHKEGQP